MKFRTLGESTIPEVAMQKLSFPPIRSGLHVTMAQKEPPERSWSKYKKVLIDNPKDSDLLHRQKLWNFQKLNRGAFRSQIASLPDIPYRHTSAVEKVSVASQVDFTQRFSRSLRVIFPNLTNRRSSFVSGNSVDFDSDESSLNKACSPMHQEISDLDEYSDDFDEDDIELDDNDLTVDEVIRKQNAGTMTDDFLTSYDKFKRQHRKRKPTRDKNPYRQTNSILSSRDNTLPSINKKKNVKFDSENELSDLNFNQISPSMEKDTSEVTHEPENGKSNVPQLPVVDIKERDIERESTGDEIPFPVENIGHSSHLALDSVSILDFISGNLTDRSRASDRGRTRDSNNMASKRRTKYSDPEADRVWFEKLVGDKELIDSETYDNFARIRPNHEPQLQNNPEKLVETNKPTPRKNFTPRINDEFPAYHSVLSKSTTSKNTNLVNSPSVTINKGGKTPRRPPVNVGKNY